MENKTRFVLDIARAFVEQTGRRDFAAPELIVPGLGPKAVRQTLRSATSNRNPEIVFSRRGAGKNPLAKMTFYRFTDAPPDESDLVTQREAMDALCKLYGLQVQPVRGERLVPLFSSQGDD